jgi:hypothetical protein
MLATLYKDRGKAVPLTDAEEAARRANAPAVRLLTSTFRRDPPGPATDNRLAQSQHFTGVLYLANCAVGTAMAGSTLRVMKRNQQPVFKSKKARRLARIVRKSKGPLANTEHHDDDLIEAPRTDRFVQLFDHVNETETISDLLTAWVIQQGQTGTAFLWCRPSQLGYAAPPSEFYVLPTALMSPMYEGASLNPEGAYPYGAWRLAPYYPGGAFADVLGLGGGSNLGVILDGREIKRHRLYHPLYRWDGYSPLTAAGVEFDVVEAISQSWKAAMDHGFRPDGIATIKGASPEVLETISAKFQQDFSGSRNANRLAFTNGEGVQFDKFFTEPRQMDYDKAWDQMVKFALAVLGVPPAVAGIVEASSYSQLFASLKQFYTNTLGPKARSISQFLTKQVVYPYEKDTLVQISVPEIDDKDFDLKKQDLLAKYSAVTVNELRGWAGKDDVEGGDELIGKEAMQPGGDAESQMAELLGQGGGPGGVDGGAGAGGSAGGMGQSQAPGGPSKPGNAAGQGSLPGKLSKSLRALVESLG